MPVFVSVFSMELCEGIIYSHLFPICWGANDAVDVSGKTKYILGLDYAPHEVIQMKWISEIYIVLKRKKAADDRARTKRYI
jgi:hypothetical protein